MANYWIERALALISPEEPGAQVVAEARPPRGRLALALQGGGSFGAFAWGVLDRLVQDDEIVIDAISGASAGAVNAVLHRSRAGRRRSGSRARENSSGSGSA